jgi:small subunit ribosomal protein S24e
MEFNVIEEKENKLLGRKELRIDLKHPAAPTPKKQDLIKELAAKYSVPEEHVVIDFIFSKRGFAGSTAKVKIYKEKPKMKEKKIKEEKKEEKPAAEEKKEEPKKEVKEEKSEAQTSEAK